MIPEPIDRYLRQHHPGCAFTTHARAVAAQRFAAAEHVTGARVAKPVVVKLDGQLALAVVSANQRVDLDTLRHAAGARRAALAEEADFSGLFEPCEAGAEPPLGLFGLRIFVDEALTREPWVAMRAGTHEDAVRLRTDEWLREDRVTPVGQLGRTLM